METVKRKLRSRTVSSAWGTGVAVACFAWLIGLSFLPATLAAEPELKNSLRMQFRLLPAGKFEQGEADSAVGFSQDHGDFNPDNDERPVHPVVLSRPFYLAATEVTRGQFREFVQATGYKTSAEQNELGAVGWDPQPPAGQPDQISTFRDGGKFHWLSPGFEQADSHPVVCVSFSDAQAFCDWLSKKEQLTYRLPTEAEWEYAARAGTSTFFSFGNQYRGLIHQFANIGNVELERAFPDRVRRQWLVDIERDPADGHIFTAPVGSYRANPWGIHDLHGNVWEWCTDRYLDTAYVQYDRGGFQEVRRRAIDPLNEQKASSDGDWRIIRGGSWFNSPVQCRSAVRGYFEANDAACYLGFRVVREAPAEVLAAARADFERAEAARETLSRLLGGLKEVRDGRLCLRVRPEHLTDEFFAALRDLNEPVDLQLDAQGKLQAADVARLAVVKHLRGLQLNGIGPAMSDTDFAPLAGHTELEQLQITGQPKLTDRLLAHLQSCTKLDLLQLDGEGLTDPGLRTLPPQPGLKTLYLNGTAVEGLALQHLQCAPLERFAGNHMTDAGAQALSQFLRLRDVSLAASPITGQACVSLAKLYRLQRLDLTGCRQIPDEAFAALGALVDLHSLVLGETEAGDRAIEGIARLNYLREIRLGSEQLSDAGVRRLCSLVSLEHVGVQEQATRLTDAALSDLWRLPNLVSLDLAAPQFTGAGLASLRELPRLESLNLSSPSLTDAALRHAAGSGTLQRISIGNGRTGGPAGVTDAGLLALAAAKKLTQVDVVRRGTEITDAGLEQLRSLRPTLKLNIH